MPAMPDRRDPTDRRPLRRSHAAGGVRRAPPPDRAPRRGGCAAPDTHRRPRRERQDRTGCRVVRSARRRRLTGWITFEDGDQGASAFWPLVVACLSATGVDVPRPPRGGHATHLAMLTALSAALARTNEPITLVLDGLEVADPALGDDIAWVLNHSGHRLRLVVLTRVDPLLPLHRFRLDDSMAELQGRRSRLHPRRSRTVDRGLGIAPATGVGHHAGRPHPGVGGGAALRRPASRRRSGPGPRGRRADGRHRQHRGVPDVGGAADPASGRSRAPAAHQRRRRAATRALRGGRGQGRGTTAGPARLRQRAGGGDRRPTRLVPLPPISQGPAASRAGLRLAASGETARTAGGALVRRRRHALRGGGARGGLGMVGRRGGVRRGRPRRGRAGRR